MGNCCTHQVLCLHRYPLQTHLLLRNYRVGGGGLYSKANITSSTCSMSLNSSVNNCYYTSIATAVLLI